MSSVYLNGQFLPAADAKISVLDRGFIFGDGVYEVWRIVEGKLFEHERHDERLRTGLAWMEIDVPKADLDALPQVAERLVRDNNMTTGEGSFYLEITRGAAPRTHFFPPAGTKPTIFAIVNKFEVPVELRAGGGKAITVPDTRWGRCDMKTLQLLPNCLAKQKAQAAGAVEAIFVRDGIVTENTASTLFGVKNGVVHTHPLGHQILPSVTRAVLLDIAAEQGVTVIEKAFSEKALFEMDELFVAGTLTDVTPIVDVDGRKIGSGKPGPVSRQLYAGLQGRLYAGAATARA